MNEYWKPRQSLHLYLPTLLYATAPRLSGFLYVFSTYCLCMNQDFPSTKWLSNIPYRVRTTNTHTPKSCVGRDLGLEVLNEAVAG